MTKSKQSVGRQVHMGILEPAPQTLARYGLSRAEWLKLLLSQGGVCGVCEQKPKNGKLQIDHEHVAKWKSMPSSKRKLYVRGLVCWWDNKTFLSRGITIERAKNVVRFLKAYERRRPPRA